MRKIAAVTLICIVLAALIYFMRPKAPVKVNAPPVHRYVFKDYNGYVACFEDGAQNPFLVTDVIVDNLTEPDKKMLSEGVTVNGAKAMSRALEDYDFTL